VVPLGLDLELPVEPASVCCCGNQNVVEPFGFAEITLILSVIELRFGLQPQ
jgi:hypothetical protein